MHNTLRWELDDMTDQLRRDLAAYAETPEPHVLLAALYKIVYALERIAALSAT